MNILLTGATSFTGLWLARELAAAGHAITAALPRPEAGYDGLRGSRAEALGSCARLLFERPVGSPPFIETIRTQGPWDALCLHGARVGPSYKDPAFDCMAAVAENCRNLPEALDAFAASGGKAVISTGTVFEADEGAGEPGAPLEAFSPYGLSKTLTWQAVRFHARARGLTTAKFVIPNPFGPWEEPRFTGYLASTWLAGNVAEVRTPAYVRDNIHVSLLAATYRILVDRATAAPQGSLLRLNPSGYRETVGEFTARFAREMEPRLAVPCRFRLLEQREFPEPRMRVNTQPAAELATDWDESRAWDQLADWYSENPQSGITRQRTD